MRDFLNRCARGVVGASRALAGASPRPDSTARVACGHGPSPGTATSQTRYPCQRLSGCLLSGRVCGCEYVLPSHCVHLPAVVDVHAHCTQYAVARARPCLAAWEWPYCSRSEPPSLSSREMIRIRLELAMEPSRTPSWNQQQPREGNRRGW